MLLTARRYRIVKNLFPLKYARLDQRAAMRCEIKGEPKAEDIRGVERHADLVVKEWRRV